MAAPVIVVLVPWRGGDELREQSWDITLPYLKRLGWPVVCGDSVGEWSRAAAINAAAADAGSWDVAIIADADTIPPSGLDVAADRALESCGGIRPHDHLYRLSPSGSIVVGRSGVEALEARHIMDTYPGGGYLVVAREAWDRIGGFDERFIGWGHEDTAFGISLLTKADWDRMPGEAWHLWHPDPPKRTQNYTRNHQLISTLRYENQRALRDASARKGFNVEAYL